MPNSRLNLTLPLHLFIFTDIIIGKVNNLTYNINYSETNNIVTLSIIGLIKISQSMIVIDEMIKKGRINNCNLFVLDGDGAVIQDNSIEVYMLFDNLKLYIKKHSDRLALVFKKQKNVFGLFDTVAVNYGLSIKSFNDNDRACRWLKIKPNIAN